MRKILDTTRPVLHAMCLLTLPLYAYYCKALPAVQQLNSSSSAEYYIGDPAMTHSNLRTCRQMESPVVRLPQLESAFGLAWILTRWACALHGTTKLLKEHAVQADRICLSLVHTDTTTSLRLFGNPARLHPCLPSLFADSSRAAEIH